MGQPVKQHISKSIFVLFYDCCRKSNIEQTKKEYSNFEYELVETRYNLNKIKRALTL